MAVLVIITSSCAKELDLVPESGVSPDQINAGNINFFLNGLYRRSMPERDNYVLQDVRGGNYTWTALSGSNSAYGVLITGDNVDDRLSFSASLWTHAYRNIYNANVIIEAVDRLGGAGNLQKVKAEACYLRAYLYYQLVTNFGGVPLILTNTTENIPRNPAAEVWNQILIDIDFAIANADPFQTTGIKKISVEAAQAFKSRVLLALDRKEEAATLAASTISALESRAIDANYGRIFRNTDASSEVIFAFSNLVTESNIRMSSLFWPYGTEWAGSYFVQPSTYAINELYQVNDVRRNVNIQDVPSADGVLTIVSKYWDVQPMVISRLSELYLICAEGFGMANGLQYLNELRQARGLAPRAAADFQTAGSYLDEVLQERRRELYSEGFLFYDLVRTDKAIDLPNVRTRAHYLLPLPGAQVNLSENVLEQNDSY
ncbi:RagB/SusD family nutrient uptake outer membrane protein [Parapedobacter deserti]